MHFPGSTHIYKAQEVHIEKQEQVKYLNQGTNSYKSSLSGVYMKAKLFLKCLQFTQGLRSPKGIRINVNHISTT